jgi:hypothetical protein
MIYKKFNNLEISIFCSKMKRSFNEKRNLWKREDIYRKEKRFIKKRIDL